MSEWVKEEPLIKRLMHKIPKEFLLHFKEKNRMESLTDFCYKKRISFLQARKYKKWFKKKRMITCEKKGRFEIITLTEIGREIVNSLVGFITIVDLCDQFAV